MEAVSLGCVRTNFSSPVAMRHVRLYGLFARTCLLREMMFRANFLVRLITHAIWLSLMLIFLKVIFLHTRRIGDWDEHRLLFFMGTYLTLNASVNYLFMTGCGRLSELIRTGNLDFELLKPIDEQFLLTFSASTGRSCRRFSSASLG